MGIDLVELNLVFWEKKIYTTDIFLNFIAALNMRPPSVISHDPIDAA